MAVTELRILAGDVVHKGYKDAAGTVFTPEGCNLDDAANRIVITPDELAGTSWVGVEPIPCKRCFKGE
jgi:hypothetical protein